MALTALEPLAPNHPTDEDQEMPINDTQPATRVRGKETYMQESAIDTGSSPVCLTRYAQEPRHGFLVNGRYCKLAVNEDEALAHYEAAGLPFGPVDAVVRTCGVDGDTCELCQLDRLADQLIGARVVAVRDAADAEGRRRLLLDLLLTGGTTATVAFEVVTEAK